MLRSGKPRQEATSARSINQCAHQRRQHHSPTTPPPTTVTMADQLKYYELYRRSRYGTRARGSRVWDLR
jgi:hypothetical protein